MKARRNLMPSLFLPSSPVGDDFRPTASLEMLRFRAELLRRTRDFFERRGFLEVETPVLSADTVVDRHLDPFEVEVGGLPVEVGRSPVDVGKGGQSTHGTRGEEQAGHGIRGEEQAAHGTRGDEQARHGTLSYYLQTSPEFAMKRLLAAGAEAIYQVAHVFRRDELGPLHNPEFTMVEWYRAGDGYDAGMTLLGELAETLFGRGPAERISYREAFEQYVGLDPHAARTDQIVAAVRERQIESPASLSPADRDSWLDLLLIEVVQPRLGRTRPVILFDYPAMQSALARVRDDGPRGKVAERFELYVDGIELANGYHELTDAEELARRNAETNLRRQMDGKQPLPGESRLAAAMRAGLPQSTGVALGFDRVVMLAAGAKTLAEVMPFPFDRA